MDCFACALYVIDGVATVYPGDILQRIDDIYDVGSVFEGDPRAVRTVMLHEPERVGAVIWICLYGGLHVGQDSACVNLFVIGFVRSYYDESVVSQLYRPMRIVKNIMYDGRRIGVFEP